MRREGAIQKQADSFQSKASKEHPCHHKGWKWLWKHLMSSELQQDKVCMSQGKGKQGGTGHRIGIRRFAGKHLG